MGPDSLIDRYGRAISYLRVSLTDRCNFRCTYCMPPEGVAVTPKATHLTADEIIRFARVAATLGIRRVRLTGGEPTLRSDLIAITSRLAAIDGITDLAMTTNGSRLATLSAPLKAAGLKRINVSLDSLNEATFRRMSLSNDFGRVMDGLLTAIAAGLAVKINVVVMKGLNDAEIPDFVAFALANPVAEVRFIEFMPLCGTGWKPEHVLTFDEVIPNLKRRFDLTPISGAPDDVAQSFLASDGKASGRIGFIPTISKPFCGACSRLRLAADGVIRPCLFATQGVPVRDLLRFEPDDTVLIEAIKRAVHEKPAGNEFAAAARTGTNMSQHIARPKDRNAHAAIRTIGG